MFVKICGITTVDDAELAADAGADAIGLNFVPGSPRRIELQRAREIADAVRGRVEIFGVVADLADDQILELVRGVGLDSVQLHGRETPEDADRLTQVSGPGIVKAVRLGTRDDVAAARRFSTRLLVDAKVAGALGGTGQKADWSLAAELAAEREVILAGGLDAENVADAIRAVAPFGVDVASGVERAPGVKDAEKVRRFVARAREAAG